MSATELLTSLRAAGFVFEAHEDRLRVYGPADALTPEVQERLQPYKPTILALLAMEQAWAIVEEIAEAGNRKAATALAYDARGVYLAAAQLRAEVRVMVRTAWDPAMRRWARAAERAGHLPEADRFLLEDADEGAESDPAWRRLCLDIARHDVVIERDPTAAEAEELYGAQADSLLTALRPLLADGEWHPQRELFFAPVGPARTVTVSDGDEPYSTPRMHNLIDVRLASRVDLSNGGSEKRAKSHLSDCVEEGERQVFDLAASALGCQARGEGWDREYRLPPPPATLGYRQNPDGPGWIETLERAAACVFHADRPLAPGDTLCCPECRVRLDTTDVGKAVGVGGAVSETARPAAAQS